MKSCLRVTRCFENSNLSSISGWRGATLVTVAPNAGETQSAICVSVFVVKGANNTIFSPKNTFGDSPDTFGSNLLENTMSKIFISGTENWSFISERKPCVSAIDLRDWKQDYYQKIFLGNLYKVYFSRRNVKT